MSGQGASAILGMFVGKEVSVSGGVVHLEMVGESSLRVGDTFLFGPKDVLTLFPGGLGPWEKNDGLLEVIVVQDAETYIRDLDVYAGVKTFKFRDSDFSQACSAPEGGCEACEDGSIYGVAEVQS